MGAPDVGPMSHTAAVSTAAAPVIVSRSEEVEALVRELFDPARTDPVVVVTTRCAETEPLIDVEALARELHPVPVRVLRTGPLTWELTGLLPEGLGVFGGAARIWWPGFTRSDLQYRHPLIFIYSPDEGTRAARRIVDEIDTRSWSFPASAPAPRRSDHRPVKEGSTVLGTARWAAPSGAEVEIAPQRTGWLLRRRRDPAVQVGDRVEVRVAGYEDGAPLLERPPRPATRPSEAGAALTPSS